MPLTEGQVQVGDLVMGPGTNFLVLDDFNPWTRQARTDQTQPRAWGHGSWSGAEWQGEAVVPLRVRVRDLEDGSTAGWLGAHQELAAAFAPSHTDVELRWVTGGTEYMLRGRPRMVDPDTTSIRRGYAITRCAFTGTDPLIYSGEERVALLSLPTTAGGLTVPFTVPVTVAATVLSGRQAIVNGGKATVGLQLRIDGPVQGPRVSLLAGATVATLQFNLDLASGQWLDIDTGARTVYLNGTASRRGLTFGTWPAMPPGPAEIAFDSDVYDPDAVLAVTWRDAWI